MPTKRFKPWMMAIAVLLVLRADDLSAQVREARLEAASLATSQSEVAILQQLVML